MLFTINQFPVTPQELFKKTSSEDEVVKLCHGMVPRGRQSLFPSLQVILACFQPYKDTFWA